MIKVSEFSKRRKQLMRMASEDAILILPAASERVRSKDTTYPYRQDSDFWYLSGFAEPEAVLVLVPGRKHGECVLFCRERNPDKEAWDGPRIGQQDAIEKFGMDDAYPISDLDDILPGLLEGRTCVYYHFGRDTDFDLKLIRWLNQVRAQERQGTQSSHEFLELGHLLHELRLFKSAGEIKLMQRAADIACQAQRAAMHATRHGAYEYEVEAVLQYVYRKNNARAAYEPIVGAGANGCILHYIANNAPMKNGDLLLVDAGAEVANYASDVTRTWPVSGRYTKEQRALYEIVLAAQQAALEKAYPGQHWVTGHQVAVAVLVEGLLSLGLLKGSLKKNLVSGDFKRFYRHKTGHWLGLDVHDVGEYKVAGEFRELEPGMVFTIEPGLYIPPGSKGVPEKYQGIGIRIEDDVLITKQGHQVLTEAVPKQIDEIEAVLAMR